MPKKAKGINAISTHFNKTDFNQRKAAMEKNSSDESKANKQRGNIINDNVSFFVS